MNWVCGENLDPYFLAYILRASRDYILSLATGAVHKTVYVPTVKEFRICLPDIGEQKKLTERLNAQLQEVETLKNTLTDQLESISKLPSALLRKAFTSKI